MTVASSETARVTIVVAVDPVTAFSVFTDDVDAWWARGPQSRFRAPWAGIMRFEPGVGGRLMEIYDEETGDAYEVGRIRVWEPGHRIVLDWRLPNFAPDEITEVEISFEPVEGGTRVSVEHRGWEALRLDHPARHGLTGDAFRMFRSRLWAEHLTAIKRHAEVNR